MRAERKDLRRAEAPREAVNQHLRALRAAVRVRSERLLGRSVGSAKVDRLHQEKARWPHSTAAGSEALRDLCVRGEQLAFAVPAPGTRQRRWRGQPAAELAPQSRIPGRLLARYIEDGRHLQGGQQLLWVGAIQRWPRSQGSARQLPR